MSELRHNTDQVLDSVTIDCVIHTLSRSQLSDRPRRTLFEALDFGHKENPHSDLIAFLLSPDSPLQGGWLLEEVCGFAKIDRRYFSGQLRPVERERQEASGRPDIVIRWIDPNYVLLIEHKIRSSEGENQCWKYLNDFGIESEAQGKLIFLTPGGAWPENIPRNDARVVQMRHVDLLGLMAAGLDKHEKSGGSFISDGSVFLTEYIHTWENITGSRREYPMVETISKETASWLANDEKLTDARIAACQESYTLFLFTVDLVRNRMKEMLRPFQENTYHDSTFLFRRESWRIDGVVFGISISGEISKPTRLLTEYGIIIGIRIQPDATEGGGVPTQTAVARNLTNWLNSHGFPTRSQNKWWAFYKSKKFHLNNPDPQKSVDNWRQDVLKAMVELSETAAPLIDGFVENEKVVHP